MLPRNEGGGVVIKREDVRIYEYPGPGQIQVVNEGDAATLGDLHGNAAKFLQMLVREGVIDVSKEDYEALTEIYKTSANPQYDLPKFISLLDKIKLKQPCPRLRLIGDDFADRGKSDTLTAAIFDRLDALQANYEVIASNHGMEFLKQLAYGIDKDLKILYQGGNASFGASLHGLRKDIENGLITTSKIEAILDRAYLPKVKLLSYLVTGPDQISIYSHAPINETKISLLARLMNVEFKAESMNELADTIDRINQAFNAIVTDKQQLAEFFNDLDLHPWKFKILDDFINDRYEELRPDVTQRDYKVLNVHGHVGEAARLLGAPVANWSYVNLDSDLGKTEHIQHVNRSYLAYVSQESRFVLQLKADQSMPDIEDDLQEELVPMSLTDDKLSIAEQQIDPQNQDIEIGEKEVQVDSNEFKEIVVDIKDILENDSEPIKAIEQIEQDQASDTLKLQRMVDVLLKLLDSYKEHSNPKPHSVFQLSLFAPKNDTQSLNTQFVSNAKTLIIELNKKYSDSFTPEQTEKVRSIMGDSITAKRRGIAS